MRMARIKPKVEFEPVEMKIKPGWYVRVTLPHGEQPRLGSFNTEAEARDWMKHKSFAWLNEYERSKYA
jgi:NAD(P)H-flavin reductase